MECRLPGLVARGSFVISMEWKDHRLASATIEPRIGNDCQIRSATPLKIVDANSHPVETKHETSDLITFVTEAGKTYKISN